MFKITIVDDLLRIDLEDETSAIDAGYTTKTVNPAYAVTLSQYGIQSKPVLFAAALEQQLADIMAMSETLVFNAQPAFLEALGLIEDLAKNVSPQLSETMAMTEELALSVTDVVEEALAVVEDLALTSTVVLPTEIMSLSELDFAIDHFTGYFAGVGLQDDLALSESILFGVSLDYIEQTTLVEIPVLTFTTTLVEDSVTASEVFAITPNIIYTDTIVSSEDLTIYLQDYVQDYLPIDYVGQLYQY